MGVLIKHYPLHSMHSDGWMRHRSYAFADNSIPDLEGFQSEAYVCGDIPPHYPVPATFQDCLTNHEQWRVQQYLNRKR